MTRAHKFANLLGVVLPFVGLVAAIGLLWNTWVSWTDLALLAVGYVLTGVGITVGYHRLFTHRAFQTKQWMRWTFAILGSMAVEGPVLVWVADHRKHHQFSDVEGDPHSPHTGSGNGFVAAAKNLFHAHMGWLFVAEGRAELTKYVPDMLSERGMKQISKLFWMWLVVSLVVPAAIGYAIAGTWQGALTALLWGGAIRIFLLHHVTFSINSRLPLLGPPALQDTGPQPQRLADEPDLVRRVVAQQPPRVPVLRVPRDATLRGCPRSGRLGDHRAREARIGLEGRAHSARAPGFEVARRLSPLSARLLDRPGVAGRDEGLQVAVSLGIVELRLHEFVVAVARNVSEDAERDDAVLRVVDP